MSTYNETIIAVIKSSYDTLTSVEKGIADYFLHPIDDTNFAAKNISKKLYVSNASLSRFSQKLGFKGYREFVYAYTSAVIKHKDLDSLTKNVLQSYQKILEDTYDIIDNNQMVRVSTMMDYYPRVYVYGTGSSAVAAREFKLRFMRLGLHVDYLADPHSIRMNITRVDKECLVFGISISGKTDIIIDELGHAKQKGATCVLISSNKIQENTSCYDELVLVGKVKNLEASDKISPQYPILLVIDILYSHYLNQDYINKKHRLDETLDYIHYDLE
ncbi:MAG: MurR/RpiR family transcriptional regulator [Coprobacillaceae bacterium]